MLTADLVVARRHKGELRLKKLDAKARLRAEEIAAAYVAAVDGLKDVRRGDVMAALDEVIVPARDRKVALGLRKLLLDRCEFSTPEGIDPAELRRRVFEQSAARRREQGDIDADALLAEVGAELGLSAEQASECLYADLREAHRLMSFASVAAPTLVEGWELANLQAALLRATRVVATVEASTEQLRFLFRKIKFRRLLHQIEPTPKGCRITLDGPLSLFSQSTKYGLALALVLPSILACDRYRVDAELAWGKRRERLSLSLEGKGRGAQTGNVELPAEVATLLRRVNDGKSAWTAEPAAKVLDLPGVGLCVPDLRCSHGDSGEIVYFEALGYWSRDAVWKRVELVEAGLPYKIVFGVSTRLRVSESVLDDELPGALLVYKGSISEKHLVEKLDSLLG